MELELSLEFLRVVEEAAIASSKTMGEGKQIIFAATGVTDGKW